MTVKEDLTQKIMEALNWDLEKTLLWFNTRNPLLGGLTPDFILNSGREEKLIKFITISLDENTKKP